MQPFTKVHGVILPIDRANIDTDAIIPKQYLKSIERTGFGANLFDDWRYLDPGEPFSDHSTRRPNPACPLNDPRLQQATFLLTRENFGCGSSREHAVWALVDYGIRAVIAPSFADIFFNNTLNNGLLALKLASTEIDQLFTLTGKSPGCSCAVDLERQQLMLPEGRTIGFDIEPSRRRRLLNGLDDIGLTLLHAEEIHRFQARRQASAPWLF